MLDGSVGFVLDGMPHRGDPIDFGVLLVAIDQRPARAVDRLSFADPLKLSLASILGQWEAKLVSVVELDRVHDGSQLGTPLLARRR